MAPAMRRAGPAGHVAMAPARQHRLQPAQHTPRLAPPRAASSAQQASVTAQSASQDEHIASLKQRLRDLTTGKEGLVQAEDQKAAVKSLLDEFEGLGDDKPAQQDIDNTHWHLVFTDTRRAPKALSALVPKGTMHYYPGGNYVAGVHLLGGFIQIDLVATVEEKNPARQDVTLLRNDLKIAGRKVGSRSLDNLPKGYHKLRYCDEDVRIFRTNAGSDMAAIRMPDYKPS